MMLDSLKGTTPPEVTRLVKKFCATFSDAKPEYVPVTPVGEAGYCYPNVKKRVDEEGGEIVYGRMIWLGKAMIEAEWHAVWQKDGRIVDVTAKPDHEERILFVRTDEVWDGKTVFPNFRRLLTNNPQVRQLIAMQEALERNATRLDDGRIRYDLAPVIRNLFGASAPREAEPVAEPVPASVKPVQAVPAPRKYHARRNDPCPCGSGKKFKKCCMIVENAPTEQQATDEHTGGDLDFNEEAFVTAFPGWQIKLAPDVQLNDDDAFTVAGRILLDERIPGGKDDVTMTYGRFNRIRLFVIINRLDKTLWICPREKKDEILANLSHIPMTVMERGKVIGNSGPVDDGQHRHKDNL